MSIADKLQTILENEQKVFDAGKKAEYDSFWDNYQQNGNSVTYVFCFAGNGWNDETYNPKYPIRCRYANSSNNMFSYSSITDTLVPIYIDGSVTSMSGTFGSTKLKTIRELVLTEKTGFAYLFNNSTDIEYIKIVGTIGQNGFDIQWSTKLNRESIESIINALSSSTSGLTVTLSKTAVNKAFETSTGANNGSTSSQWATLIATKSNWTISLV